MGEKIRLCKNCIHWKRYVCFTENSKGEAKIIDRVEGECHRYPPIVTSEVIRVSVVRDKLYKSSTFPETQEDEYCGEFKNE